MQRLLIELRLLHVAAFRATAASAMPMPTSIAAAATAHRVAVVALPRSLTEIIKIACGTKQIENGSRDEANC